MAKRKVQEFPEELVILGNSNDGFYFVDSNYGVGTVDDQLAKGVADGSVEAGTVVAIYHLSGVGDVILERPAVDFR